MVPRTRTVIEQEAPAAKGTPDKLTEVASLVAVRVPPQVEVGSVEGAVVVVSTTKPEGRVSVKETPVKLVLVLGLLILIFKSVVPPVKIGFAVNALLITGGSITVKDACPKPTFGVVLVFGPLSVEVILVLVLV